MWAYHCRLESSVLLYICFRLPGSVTYSHMTCSMLRTLGFLLPTWWFLLTSTTVDSSEFRSEERTPRSLYMLQSFVLFTFSFNMLIYMYTALERSSCLKAMNHFLIQGFIPPSMWCSNRRLVSAFPDIFPLLCFQTFSLSGFLQFLELCFPFSFALFASNPKGTDD